MDAKNTKPRYVKKPNGATTSCQCTTYDIRPLVFGTIRTIACVRVI